MAKDLGQTGTGNTPLPLHAKLKTGRSQARLTVTRSKIPTDDDERKSFSLGRYHFRKDGAGYECREVIGTGASRKRPYLAYLSRATLDEMKAASLDDAVLEAKLIAWAERKREEKRGK